MSHITLPRAVVEQVRDALSDYGRHIFPYTSVRLEAALAALDAALKEPEPALQIDAERYRWIAENALAIDFVADPDNMVRVWHGTDPAKSSAGRTLDDAIDTARGISNE